MARVPFCATRIAKVGKGIDFELWTPTYFNCIIRAYWEFKLQQAGIWSVGLANPGCDLNRNLGTDLNSWCLTQDNVIMFNGDIEHKLEPKIQEGDVIVSLQMINYPCSLTNQFHH